MIEYSYLIKMTIQYLLTLLVDLSIKIGVTSLWRIALPSKSPRRHEMLSFITGHFANYSVYDISPFNPFLLTRFILKNITPLGKNILVFPINILILILNILIFSLNVLLFFAFLLRASLSTGEFPFIFPPPNYGYSDIRTDYINYIVKKDGFIGLDDIKVDMATTLETILQKANNELLQILL